MTRFAVYTIHPASQLKVPLHLVGHVEFCEGIDDAANTAAEMFFNRKEARCASRKTGEYIAYGSRTKPPIAGPSGEIRFTLKETP